MTQTLLPTGLTFHAVAEDGLRGANDIFRAALHIKPASDESWAILKDGYRADRTFGAFDGDRQVGTAMSFPSALTVPGGATLTAAGVTYVGVRSDYRRRGALTGMMRAQLEDCAARGDVLAVLHASEPGIYSRFGYGLTMLSRTVTVRSPRAVLRPEVPVSGVVRLLDQDEIVSTLEAAYPSLQSRVGAMARPSEWWAFVYRRRLHDEFTRVAAHYGAEGAVDGWVTYQVVGDESDDDPRGQPNLRVLDFQAADQGAANDLWRFLIGVDLIDDVVAYLRPTDDPIEEMLVDSFAVRSERDEELWLRMVDVPAALAARTYGTGEPVVIEVVDSLLPDNSGRYRVGPHGTERTTDAPALTVTASVLAMLYFGTYRAGTLAGIGQVSVADPAALPAVDRLFAVDRPAWNGTMF
ncbi:GNAT family N-acetyltransferase [Actinophytocola oryzae]|uniref:Putative acetyltransferase n=1 Tax=Actinophytocola oryzae TaxID=502181 RepID=A0A4R7V7F9_9PSEU|nr:GNAT family N-acetyltransferase [Actinophytocola oryzae]TDV44882.1 putative acetyltransferase [Actinophytocola oryzae]